MEALGLATHDAYHAGQMQMIARASHDARVSKLIDHAATR
jgi:hypothetical protein